MRIVLSLLLSFVLLQAQCFALSGGPVYPGIGIAIGGTYAGVLIPDGEEGDNSLGIFTLGVPVTGLSTGDFLMFSEGRVFTGTINAFGDPDKGSIKGVLQATFDFTVTVPGPDVVLDPGPPVVTGPGPSEELTIQAEVSGQIDARVIPNLGFFGVANRLIGSASLDISQGQVDADFTPIITKSIEFLVDGIQQSTEPIASGGTTGGGTEG